MSTAQILLALVPVALAVVAVVVAARYELWRFRCNLPPCGGGRGPR